VSIVEKTSELTHLSKISVPCVLSDIEVSRYGYVILAKNFLFNVKLLTTHLNLSFDDQAPRNGSDAQKQVIEKLLIDNDAAVYKCIQPEFMRLAPPIMPLGESEASQALYYLLSIYVFNLKFSFQITALMARSY